MQTWSVHKILKIECKPLLELGALVNHILLYMDCQDSLKLQELSIFIFLAQVWLRSLTGPSQVTQRSLILSVLWFFQTCCNTASNSNAHFGNVHQYHKTN